MPAIKTSRVAMARNDRRIAVLRVIELLRIYGASHDGKLPEQLADIAEVPIPIDPVTGLPFDYRLEGGKAILTGPTLRDAPLNYEITMTSPETRIRTSTPYQCERRPPPEHTSAPWGLSAEGFRVPPTSPSACCTHDAHRDRITSSLSLATAR